MVEFVSRALASRDVPSVLLPVNGHYIDPKTPITHRGGNLHLPFREVILEYSMSEAGFYRGVPHGNVKPSSVLLWVVQLTVDRAVMFPMYRATGDTYTKWVPPALSVGFSTNTRVSIDETGEVRMYDVDADVYAREALSEQQIAQLLRDYVDELQVLVYFSKICQSAGIGVQARPWPPGIGPDKQPLPAENYYVLTATGPTNFSWLPASGMPTTEGSQTWRA
jgi:hypothetical protein